MGLPVTVVPLDVTSGRHRIHISRVVGHLEGTLAVTCMWIFSLPATIFTLLLNRLEGNMEMVAGTLKVVSKW